MEKIIRVGVDVDDVLRDITSTMMNLFKKHHPDAVKSDVVDGWDFPNVDLPLEKKLDMMFKEFPKEVFLYSEPLKNTKEEFAKLKKWAEQNNVRLVCVTTQEEHLIGLTYMWLAMHNFLFKEVYIEKNKYECPIDYLIDDAQHNFENWVKAGRDPETFLLFDAPRNQHANAPIRIKCLTEAIQYIKI